MDDIPSLFAHTVDVFAYNQMQRKMTWEPMIFAEFGPTRTDGTIRVKFVPIRKSPAFPDDLICYWTEKQLQRRMRKREPQQG